jgi:hypothetical protein
MVSSRKQNEGNPDALSTEPNQGETRYFRLASRQFVFANAQMRLFLYPGVSAVVTGEQLDLLEDSFRVDLEITPITQAEYDVAISKQGLLGAS